MGTECDKKKLHEILKGLIKILYYPKFINKSILNSWITSNKVWLTFIINLYVKKGIITKNKFIKNWKNFPTNSELV